MKHKKLGVMWKTTNLERLIASESCEDFSFDVKSSVYCHSAGLATLLKVIRLLRFQTGC